MGMPTSRHNRVAVAEVRRLNNSADTDASEVMSSGRVRQETELNIASTGSATKTAPTAAGR
jgi:hypothetical protein